MELCLELNDLVFNNNFGFKRFLVLYNPNDTISMLTLPQFQCQFNYSFSAGLNI